MGTKGLLVFTSAEIDLLDPAQQEQLIDAVCTIRTGNLDPSGMSMAAMSYDPEQYRVEGQRNVDLSFANFACGKQLSQMTQQQLDSATARSSNQLSPALSMEEREKAERGPNKQPPASRAQSSSEPQLISAGQDASASSSEPQLVTAGQDAPTVAGGCLLGPRSAFSRSSIDNAGEG